MQIYKCLIAGYLEVLLWSHKYVGTSRAGAGRSFKAPWLDYSTSSLARSSSVTIAGHTDLKNNLNLSVGQRKMATSVISLERRVLYGGAVWMVRRVHA